MGAEWDWTVPDVCDQCGKYIFMPDKGSWAYKITRPENERKKGMPQTAYFCSWHCIQEYRKMKKVREKRKHG